jgi:hypothetical protein
MCWGQKKRTCGKTILHRRRVNIMKTAPDVQKMTTTEKKPREWHGGGAALGYRTLPRGYWRAAGSLDFRMDFTLRGWQKSLLSGAVDILNAPSGAARAVPVLAASLGAKAPERRRLEIFSSHRRRGPDGREALRRFPWGQHQPHPAAAPIAPSPFAPVDKRP